MINGYHYVTLASDASASPARVGMAYYIRDDSGVTKDAWYIDGQHSSTMAEWFALERAVEVLAARTYPKNTKLIYYGDNSTMIALLTGEFKNRRSRRNWTVKQRWTLDILNKFIGIEARHVPSHTNRKDGARFALNRWCDFNARSMVRHGRLHQYRFPHRQA